MGKSNNFNRYKKITYQFVNLLTMNIAYLARFDPRDKKVWSGTANHIYVKLKENHRIEIIGPELISQLGLYHKDNFRADVFVPVDRYINKLSKLLSERINNLDCDLVFNGDIFFIPSDINVPFVLHSDMTYEQVKIHYSKPIDNRNIEPCINLERILLNNAFRIIYSSEWTKQKAIEVYGIDPNKIHVVEFGANIPTPQNYSIDINTDICRLVFIGADWERKCGDKVLQIYQILKDEGFPCTLTIIGSEPEDEPEEEEDDLTIIPKLDKARPEDLRRLCDIIAESHFLVLPTRFDAFGIVFCEASAFAVPSIAADVGGVSQAVKEGKNGYLLPAEATARDYAEKIKDVFSDKENYIKLRRSSRIEFETRLNWDVWGEKVNRIFEEAVEEWGKLKTKN